MTSKKRSPKGHSKPVASAPRRLSLRDLLIPLTATVVGIALGVGWWKLSHPEVASTKVSEATVDRKPKDDSSSPPTSEPKPTKVTTPIENAPANETPTATTSADFKSLIGKWIRTDGGYIIDITSVNDSGQLKAAYLNPRPINVAQAKASKSGDFLKAFIELRDENYPGSTYDLMLDVANDKLIGDYFQAVQRQTFPVEFERSK